MKTMSPQYILAIKKQSMESENTLYQVLETARDR